MADADLNINLNESQSTETFSVTGEPTSSRSQAGTERDDPGFASLADQIADKFDKIIENAPEAQVAARSTIAAAELADMLDGLKTFNKPVIETVPKTAEEQVTESLTTLSADINKLIDEITPKSSEEQAKERTARLLDDLNKTINEMDPDGSNVTNQPATDGGGGGVVGGLPPVEPADSGLFDSPTPSSQPSTEAGEGGGLPPIDPPDDEGLIPEGGPEAVDSATDTATGLAFLLGPEVGMAVMGVTDIIDDLIFAFQSLEQAVHAVDDVMDSLVADTRDFSGDVASAAAMRDVANILIKLDRAQQVGPEIAKWLETRTEIDLVLGQMATDVTKTLMPLVQTGTDILLDLLTCVQLYLPVIENVYGMVSTIAAAIPGPVLDGIMKAAHEMLKKAREDRQRELLKDGGAFAKQFEDFFINQAMPIQGFGGVAGPAAVIGGFGG